MANLIVPSAADVDGIVLDVISTIAPNVKPREIDHSILLAKKLITLCFIAQANDVAEKVFTEIMQGMLGVRTNSLPSGSCHSCNVQQDNFVINHLLNY